jgi:hypothetical protein
MMSHTNTTILISGASIAGPTLAYWLKRYGFTPTVIERAPQLRAAKNLVGPVAADQMEDGIDQPAIKPLRYPAAAQRIADCLLNPGGLSIPGLFYAKSSCHVDPGGPGRKVAEAQRVVGDNLVNEQYLAVVLEKVTTREGHTITCLEWSVEASYRPDGWSPHMHIFWHDEKLPYLRERDSYQRPDANDTHLQTSLSCFPLPHEEKPVSLKEASSSPCGKAWLA